MKLSYYWSFLLLILIACKERTPTIQTLSGVDLSVEGRYDLDEENNRVELISSASHFRIKAKGDSVLLVCGTWSDAQHSYIQYELDGIYQGRLRVKGVLDTLSIPLVGTDEAWDELTFYKATEAHSGPLFVYSLASTAVQVVLPSDDRATILFIGDSITCGAAADPSDVPCGEGEYHDQHNAYASYAPRVARRLSSSYQVHSVSGIGMYRNWNSDGPTMPQVYQSLDFSTDNSRQWESQQISPDIITIALGTNDFSNGDGIRERLPFDEKEFVGAYQGFVGTMRKMYPQSKLVLLNSPMVNGERNDIFINALSEVKSFHDDNYSSPCYIFEFDDMHAKGCTGHPDLNDHKVMADQLTPFLRDLLAI